MDKQAEQQELKDIIASREDGFGHRFKVARDEQNLSIDDISRDLHLDKKIILALEAEDHTQLPASAFVCGYIRNYAKLLKIQPEPLIEYYKTYSNVDSFAPKLKIIKEKRGPGNATFSNILSQIAMPIITIVFILALLAGGWKLWEYVSEHYINNKVDAGIENITTPENDGIDSLSLPKQDESYDSQEELLDLNSSNSSLYQNELLPEKEEPLLVERSAKTEKVESASDDASSIESSLPIADSSFQTDGSSSANGSITADGSIPAEAPSLVENALQTDAVPVLVVENQLILEFSGNSWVSIKDANNKILATGLKNSSKILRLHGKTPYKVFLGDARVVKISINGEIFDHSSYINEKNVARFNVK